MEELFIYQLPDGQRVDVSNWPETEKFLWLASNPNAKAVEATEEEISMPSMDESMFGGGKMRILPEDPFMPVPKYQDFDLDKMTERLFKEDKEIVLFDSELECINKCHFYLNNPTLRKKIAAAGRQRLIKSKYDYHSRSKQMLDIIEANDPDDNTWIGA